MTSSSHGTSDRVSRLIVDAHTHIFPPEFVREREAIAPRDEWFAELYQSPKALLASEEDILASMDEAGITCSIVCGFPWKDSGLCREHNDYLLDVASRNTGRIAAVATVSPTQPDAAEEAARCLKAGAVGIGELNADAQRFDLMNPEPLAAVAEVCRAFDRPLLIHVSEPVGHRYPGKGTSTPDRLLRFLLEFPDVGVVAAHWGGGLPCYELMAEVAELTRNLVYDSAASSYLYRASVFPTVIDLVGADRVLMATDYPVLRQDRFVRRILKQDLADDVLDAIFWRNAARVYDLPLEGADR
jgi:predicted TIM-barrel fold metal-dependent hydrolase